MPLVLMSLLLACGSEAEPQPVIVEPPAAPRPEPVAEPPPLPAAPSSEPGPLWVQAEGALLRLDQDGARQVEGLPGELQAWTLDAQGQPWVVAGRSLVRVDDGLVVETVATLDPELVRTTVADLAVSADGAAWIVGPMVVASWDGSAWSPVPVDRLGPEPVLLEQIGVDEAGQVFVLGKETVLRRQGGAWSQDDLEALAPGMEFADDLVVTRDGRAWLSFVGEGARGVLAWRDGAWTPAEVSAAFDTEPETMALGPGGDLARIAPDDRHLAWGERALDLREAGTLARELQGIAVDTRGRVWARTDRGLLRWDPDGSLQEYSLGTTGLPAGGLQALAVHAGGPDLSSSEAVRAPVRGTLRKGGDWLRGTAVSLCDDSELLFQQHPCEGAELRHEARTDDLGSFSFPEVAQGEYQLVVQTGEGEYSLVLGAHCCREMLPGQTVELGELGLRD